PRQRATLDHREHAGTIGLASGEPVTSTLTSGARQPEADAPTPDARIPTPACPRGHHKPLTLPRAPGSLPRLARSAELGGGRRASARRGGGIPLPFALTPAALRSYPAVGATRPASCRSRRSLPRSPSRGPPRSRAPSARSPVSATSADPIAAAASRSSRR